MSLTRRQVIGFTLLELLVVLSILALLIALLMPALASARQEGLKTTCLSNLRAIGHASQAYVTDDASTKIIPEHPRSQNVVGEGYFIYGGNDGQAGTRWGSDRALGGAIHRPLNRFLYARSMADYTGTGARNDPSRLALYRCPSDTGLVDTPGFSPPERMIGHDVFTVTGTSYLANCLRVVARNRTTVFSAGPYMRPVNRIPATSETIAYTETLAWETWRNSNTSYGVGSDGTALFGWHKRAGTFNIAFCDGSAYSASMLPDDWKDRPTTDRIQRRGNGYRLDCRPDNPIHEGERPG